jgi:hypothetical protein
MRMRARRIVIRFSRYRERRGQALSIYAQSAATVALGHNTFDVVKAAVGAWVSNDHNVTAYFTCAAATTRSGCAMLDDVPVSLLCGLGRVHVDDGSFGTRSRNTRSRWLSNTLVTGTGVLEY